MSSEGQDVGRGSWTGYKKKRWTDNYRKQQGRSVVNRQILIHISEYICLLINNTLIKWYY